MQKKAKKDIYVYETMNKNKTPHSDLISLINMLHTWADS